MTQLWNIDGITMNKEQVVAYRQKKKEESEATSPAEAPEPIEVPENAGTVGEDLRGEIDNGDEVDPEKTEGEDEVGEDVKAEDEASAEDEEATPETSEENLTY